MIMTLGVQKYVLAIELSKELQSLSFIEAMLRCKGKNLKRTAINAWLTHNEVLTFTVRESTGRKSVVPIDERDRFIELDRLPCLDPVNQFDDFVRSSHGFTFFAV
jgi:hypothetical protein